MDKMDGYTALGCLLHAPVAPLGFVPDVEA